MRYTPVGAGSFNWIPEADGRPCWFVKGDAIRVATDATAGVERIHATFGTAAALHDGGLEFVVAQLPDSSGNLLRRITPGWALSVWPFLDGVTAGVGPWPAAADQIGMAALLGRLHAAPVPTFAPRWTPASDLMSGSIDASVPGLATAWSAGPFAETAHRLLPVAAPMIDRLAARYVELVHELEADSSPSVLTHGEPHSANVIVTTDGQRLLIDWDSARGAPREREFRRTSCWPVRAWPPTPTPPVRA